MMWIWSCYRFSLPFAVDQSLDDLVALVELVLVVVLVLVKVRDEQLDVVKRNGLSRHGRQIVFTILSCRDCG